MPRVREHVDEVVVAVHLAVRHAPGEDHLVRDAERRGLRLQRRFLRSAADEQHAHVRDLREDRRQRVEQEIQPLVCIERADEADHGLAGEPEPGLQAFVGRAAGLERGGVDGVRDDRDPLRRDAARDDVLP